jgi:hypothetical protein
MNYSQLMRAHQTAEADLMLDINVLLSACRHALHQKELNETSASILADAIARMEKGLYEER